MSWETADRFPQTLYFETAYPAAADLEPSPDAFVLACLPFAVWWQEKRIQVAGPLCARFADGLQAAMHVYARWFSRCRPLSIEPIGGFVPIRARSAARTASLLSGGVDGLAVLRANRLAYPTDHPESVRDCILLFGANDFECTADGPVAERLAAFERLEGRLRSLASEEDFSLVSVHTNTRLLSGDYTCWASVGFGAANVAVAHALSRRFSKLLLASDGNGVDPPPAGVHPLLDRYFSTEAVEIWHEHAPWTRLDKLGLLAAWPAALRLMQPCHYVTIPPLGQINCGRCEKCVRTMLGLLALGRLKEASAFPRDDVTADMVRPIPVATSGKAELLGQLVEPLRTVGRPDLVAVIERKLRAFRWRSSYERFKRRALRR